MSKARFTLSLTEPQAAALTGAIRTHIEPIGLMMTEPNLFDDDGIELAESEVNQTLDPADQELQDDIDTLDAILRRVLRGRESLS